MRLGGDGWLGGLVLLDSEGGVLGVVQIVEVGGGLVEQVADARVAPSHVAGASVLLVEELSHRQTVRIHLQIVLQGNG